MNICIFGCKNTTKFLIESLSKKYNITYLVTIDETKGTKFQVADYCDLTNTAEKYGIKIYSAKQYNLKSKDDIEHITNLDIDLAFVAGWQRLIPSKILDKISTGVFGMHGSSMDLPMGRGRSPMNWSIIEGRKYYYANLFKYDTGADSGTILDTFKFNITTDDTGETMHFKQTLAMKKMIENNFDNLLNNNFSLRKQKNVTPTYYPKRNPSDSLIDWDRDINDLDRFIRAVTKPFNGAYSYLSDSKVIIYNAQILDTLDFGYQSETNGKVVEIFPNGKFVVKCNGGLLLVNDYVCDSDIKKDEILNVGDENVYYFKTNKYGYHDLEEHDE